VNKTSEGNERLTIGRVVIPERSSGCSLERSFVWDCLRGERHVPYSLLHRRLPKAPFTRWVDAG